MGILHTAPRNKKAQASRAAIERLYIAMRHLFIRGSYKPQGVSGEALVEALMTLQPEIYGAIADPERVELDGLLYIFKRLPKGIESCRYIKLITREGFEKSQFEPIIATDRRRNCYRIDAEQMFIEMTRGRSDIYDILTHLTFMFCEADKIKRNSLDHRNQKKRDWLMLEQIVQNEQNGKEFNREVAFTYLSTLLGRTFDDVAAACHKFEAAKGVNSLFQITYWLGVRAMEETEIQLDREITFSSALRETIGQHAHGEVWANLIKRKLEELKLLNRPLHVISANLHSVMTCLYAKAALGKDFDATGIIKTAEELSLDDNEHLRHRLKNYALKNGMTQVDDTSGTNVSVQIFDLEKINWNVISPEITFQEPFILAEKPVLLVMDYAFGEQAFETMDELLKPFHEGDLAFPLNFNSISIMGKAGILEGEKGDVMIPNAHVFEGTADNYPFENDLKKDDFKDANIHVCEGPMITVLGTSLQNRNILRFFHESSWKVIGLEMEGAHYQKAIQAAAKIRKNIKADVKLRYAYYASDNPLISGQTLASGNLGLVGVYPTYLITIKILNKILNPLN